MMSTGIKLTLSRYGFFKCNCSILGFQSRLFLMGYQPLMNVADLKGIFRLKRICGGTFFHALQMSEEEISFLTGGDDPYDDNVVFKKLFHPNLKLLLVTEGPDGCRYYTMEFDGRVAGVKVKPVDTTGAGDAFVSGILCILASDLNLFQLSSCLPHKFELVGLLLLL